MVRLVRPWKARSKTTTPGRPVAAREILTAFSIASAPELTSSVFVSLGPGQSSSNRPAPVPDRRALRARDHEVGRRDPPRDEALALFANRGYVVQLARLHRHKP